MSDVFPIITYVKFTKITENHQAIIHHFMDSDLREAEFCVKTVKYKKETGILSRYKNENIKYCKFDKKY